MPRLKNNRPFKVVITDQDKENMRTNAEFFGVPYGIFFSTSGAAYYEPVNPSAGYSYIWRTDQTKTERQK